MSLAVQIDQNGGPEVMKLVDVTVGEPGPGEIRIRAQFELGAPNRVTLLCQA